MMRGTGASTSGDMASQSHELTRVGKRPIAAQL